MPKPIAIQAAHGHFLLRAMTIAACLGLAVGLYVGIRGLA